MAIQRHILGHCHATVRAIHVQVLHYNQLGATGSRALQYAALERRELLGPALVVDWIGAVVDMGRTCADTPRVNWVGGVAAHHLGLHWEMLARSAARDHPHLPALRQ